MRLDPVLLRPVAIVAIALTICLGLLLGLPYWETQLTDGLLKHQSTLQTLHQQLKDTAAEKADQQAFRQASAETPLALRDLPRLAPATEERVAAGGFTVYRLSATLMHETALLTQLEQLAAQNTYRICVRRCALQRTTQTPLPALSVDCELVSAPGAPP